MVQYAEISRDDFVLENSTRRYVDALAVVGYDDNRTLQHHHHHIIIIIIINISGYGCWLGKSGAPENKVDT